MQWAASLSETERKILIQAEIAKVIKKEQEELRAQQNNSFRGTDGRNGRNESFGNNTSGGKWYFSDFKLFCSLFFSVVIESSSKVVVDFLFDLLQSSSSFLFPHFFLNSDIPKLRVAGL